MAEISCQHVKLTQHRIIMGWLIRRLQMASFEVASDAMLCDACIYAVHRVHRHTVNGARAFRPELRKDFTHAPTEPWDELPAITPRCAKANIPQPHLSLR